MNKNDHSINTNTDIQNKKLIEFIQNYGYRGWRVAIENNSNNEYQRKIMDDLEMALKEFCEQNTSEHLNNLKNEYEHDQRNDDDDVFENEFYDKVPTKYPYP